MRVSLILDEGVVRADGVASGIVHLADIDRTRGLALLQAVLVVLDVREGQREKDDQEEEADAADCRVRARVALLLLPGEPERITVEPRHVATREQRRRVKVRTETLRRAWGPGGVWVARSRRPGAFGKRYC